MLPVRFNFAVPAAGVRLITMPPRNTGLLTALLSVALLESNPTCAQKSPPGKALVNRASAFAAEETAAAQAARRAQVSSGRNKLSFVTPRICR